jgi:hydroxyacylglutathione hydrolase
LSSERYDLDGARGAYGRGDLVPWSNAGLPHRAPARDYEGATLVPVEVPEVTPQQATELIAAGAVLLDVREPDEWMSGHAPGSVHIPMRDLPGRVAELDAGRPMVAICRSGGRSRAAAEALIGHGFDVANLAGGLRAWAAAGLPVETETGAAGIVA